MHHKGIRTRLKVDQSLMIAPLLDIMFLVLLFFMLNTSEGNIHSFDVDIPQAHQPENRYPMEQLVVIIRSAEMGYTINDDFVAEVDFIPTLKEKIRVLGVKQILLLASESADYGRVMRIMDAMKQAGASGVSLGVENVE
ncbi:biopolymer transporter ExbD [Entomospira entomophila]|uniref:Biopolymer transporter ExbD n=1 Tax=Entomospira entomophila TaxID=2719988 RepID=A0A968GAS2_9SPIO|nr:biopolymer transporter ExbD [Entomospira entomophilus]NIZ41211.1 biopolymer transporter ExbD [Entomospira entomophilus]WDI35417.1 biopolymer transporter ExbD [Entomospira entomophilus]